MSEPLQAYLQRFDRDLERLQRSLPEAVLLYEPHKEEIALEHVSLPPFELHSYRTQGPLDPAALRLWEPSVFLMEKSHRNAFGRGITVGRASNNDVVVESGSVSRFHAWFDKETGGVAHRLTDAGSKNGTFLEGVRLEARRPQLLRSGIRLTFGKVEFTFFSAADFLEMLAKRAAS